MRMLKGLNRLLTPAPDSSAERFTLGDRGKKEPVEQQGLEMRLRTARERAESLSVRLGRWAAAGLLDAPPDDLEKTGDLSADLKANVARLQFRFRSPRNIDLVTREVTLATQPRRQATVVYLDGLTDKSIINLGVLQPLMLLANLQPAAGRDPAKQGPLDALEPIEQQLVPSNVVQRKYEIHDLEQAILMGDIAVLVDGCAAALVVEAKGFPLRSITTAQTERVIDGPHDAFNESFRMNVSLVRRRIKDARFVTEVLQVGRVSNTVVGVCYIDGITNPKLVAEAKKRLTAIDVDFIGSAGMLQGFIEDQPIGLVPQVLTTERPDRAAAYLTEGSLLIMCDNSANAIVVPTTFWGLMQTSEDYTLRFPFGGFIRGLRFIALLLALLIPGLYIAATTFHQEMIPTEMLLSIAANREAVPMPAVMELLLMDFSFELIREAGIRVPNVIGATLGIIGGLILGQAAVAAKIVSPMMIIVVAITGLASFAIPNYPTAFAVRLLRFLFVLLGATLGFYGIAAGIFAVLLHLCGLRSLGVPLLGPVIQPATSNPDTIIRPQLYTMEQRPAYARAIDARRQAHITRPWDPDNPLRPKRHGSQRRR